VHPGPAHLSRVPMATLLFASGGRQGFLPRPLGSRGSSVVWLFIPLVSLIGQHLYLLTGAVLSDKPFGFAAPSEFPQTPPGPLGRFSSSSYTLLHTEIVQHFCPHSMEFFRWISLSLFVESKLTSGPMQVILVSD